MKVRLWPRSTAGQVSLIVLVSALVTHGIATGFWIVRHERMAPLEVTEMAAARADVLARACATLPDEACATLLRAAGTRRASVALVGAPPAEIVEPPKPARDAYPEARFGHDADGWTVSMPSGARWVTVRTAATTEHPPRWLSSSRLLTWLLVVGAVPMLVLTLWAVWQVTRPLRRLARATESLDPAGTTLLPEEGTREVRQLAGAFNALVGRLRGFVAERTRVLAAISHDLRTPLTRVRLRAEAIEDEELRRKMLRDVGTMETMLTATLSLLEAQARPEPAERVDVAVLAATVCDGFADAGLDVSYGGLPHASLMCRPRALERALNNLIDNAIKFAGMARVTARPSGAMLLVEVEDDGPGIPAGERARMMRPFERGAEARGADVPGSGLGLAIAQALVTGQGGTLTLDEARPSGLRAVIALPFPPPALATPTERRAPVPA